jgi:molybdopterin-guanine dinucleotide biosynthesis protein A
MTPLYGLVLAGGRSSRMQADKAALDYGRKPQLARAFELLAPRVQKAWVSVRADQRDEPLRARYPQVVDGKVGGGPIAGIIAAQALHPDAAWLVLACDLPLLDGATLDRLLAGRDAGRASREPVLRHVAAGRLCPRRFLAAHDVALLEAPHPHALDNANTPQDAEALRALLASSGPA